MFPFGASGGRPPGFYQIDRSLRFNDDDSAYLSRTPGSAGNRKTWTWSGWVKRGNLTGAHQCLFAGFFSSNNDKLAFDPSNKLEFVWNDTTDGQIVSTAVFRDPSAWYHIVAASDTTQATASNRMKLYVNGVQITAFDTANYPTQNRDGGINNNVLHRSGSITQVVSQLLDGYMTEIHFIDGTALDPTSFGEFDTNGVWRPIQVSGLTYGTNGFYLSFADNTSTTTLGYDDAGSNDWTLNNFSVTAGTGNDSLEDTPTNNFCTLNLLDGGSGSLANGNLQWAMNAGSGRRATFGMSTGKWYWEVVLTAGTNPAYAAHGIQPASGALTGYGGTVQIPSGYGYFGNSGNKITGTSLTAYGSTFTTNDVISVAFDADAGKIWFAKAGTWQASGDPAAGTNEAFSGIPTGTYFPYVSNQTTSNNDHQGYVNFGQRPFAYTPPSGFVALCTANLPTPVIANPGKHMNAVTYTGTGSSLGVTGVGFQPDLVWLKSRSAATDHALYDAVRGVQAQLESNTTTDQTTEATGLTAFGADGFTIGSLAQVNTNTATYVGWCWKEGVTPGFDIVTYTGNGTARTISHNLGTTPKMIIVKARTTASTDQGWPVYHASNTAAPETDYLLLNSTAATADLNTVWNDTAPTTTVFSVGTNALVNANNDTYVAYLFAEVEGFSKFGSYTGNGSADGPFVWCGFRPKFVLIRALSGIGSWEMLDSARDPANPTGALLRSESSGAELAASPMPDFLSNGFKCRSTNGRQNDNGVVYIFAAFSEIPFSAPAPAR